jgi:hypothetical protein
LDGRDWSKVRGFLAAAESQTFLDRLHRQLEQAGAIHFFGLT